MSLCATTVVLEVRRDHLLSVLSSMTVQFVYDSIKVLAILKWFSYSAERSWSNWRELRMLLRCFKCIHFSRCLFNFFSVGRKEKRNGFFICFHRRSPNNCVTCSILSLREKNTNRSLRAFQFSSVQLWLGGSWGSGPLPLFWKERSCPLLEKMRSFRLE